MQRLTKTAKILDTILRVLFWVLIAAAVAATIGALAPLILRRPAPSGTDVSLDLDFIKLHLAKPGQEAAMAQQKATLAAMVLMIAGTGIGAYAIKLIRNILKPMKQGLPFHSAVSGSLKKLGWLSLFGGIVTNGVSILAQNLIVRGFNLTELFTSEVITKVTFNYSFDLTFLLVAAGLFLLSYIFHYGAQLQQLSDETL